MEPARCGHVLADRYEIKNLLSTGGMGAVYRAVDHCRSGAPCAVKIMRPQADWERDALARFLNEAHLASQLRHPNIVEVWELHSERSLAFLVMELLNGMDLQAVLTQTPRLQLAEVLPMVRQVASALHATHSVGIIHRDIKPKNLFLCHQHDPAGNPLVKVVDFGLSKSMSVNGEAQITTIGQVLGTPQYMAPEMTYGGQELVDHRADQWSLAVVAYRMLSGRLPFESRDFVELIIQIRQRPAPPLSGVVPSLPPHVVSAIARALSKRPEERFPSILEFCRALQDAPSAPRCTPKRRVMPVAPDSGRSLSAEGATEGPAAEPRPAEISRGPKRGRRMALSVALLGCATGLALLWVAGSRAGHYLPDRSSRPGPAQYLPGTTPSEAAPTSIAAAAGTKHRVTLPGVDSETRSEFDAEERAPGYRNSSQGGRGAYSHGSRNRRKSAVSPPDAPHPEEVTTASEDPAEPEPVAAATDSPPPSPSPPQRSAPPSSPRHTPPQWLATPPQRRSGIEPSLPAHVRQLFRGQTLESQYIVCTDASGSVQSVRATRSLPLADEAIQATLRSWHYPSLPTTSPPAPGMQDATANSPNLRCWIESLRFELE